MERGNDIEKAVTALTQGALVIVPTETSYGIAADALDAQALKLLFAVKRRKPNEAVGIFLPDMQTVQEHFSLAPEENALARQYWPGPVNIVLTPRAGSPLVALRSILAPGKTRLSIRISSHPVIAAACQALQSPITSTSANHSGDGDVYDPALFADIFTSDEIAYLFDGGVLPQEKPSTVVEWNGTTCIVHRQGAIHIAI
ncbi:MAG: L-threonylcarbamoyladenylate synthase [Patescibacteria group bacterium]|jgi:L-threonylcarbamoyladenylate synthase